jgi:hypothetical protein
METFSIYSKVLLGLLISSYSFSNFDFSLIMNQLKIT